MLASHNVNGSTTCFFNAVRCAYRDYDHDRNTQEDVEGVLLETSATGYLYKQSTMRRCKEEAVSPAGEEPKLE